MGTTENHVIFLCERLLGPSRRRATYDWARGDLSAKTGRAALLPFDAAWDARKLIIEVNEEQHRSPDMHFDKPDVVTVSGVHRGVQRRVYFERKRRAAAEQGFTVVDIDWSRKRRPSPDDIDVIEGILRNAGVLPT